jgi:hypothetical protein
MCVASTDRSLDPNPVALGLSHHERDMYLTCIINMLHFFLVFIDLFRGFRSVFRVGELYPGMLKKRTMWQQVYGEGGSFEDFDYLVTLSPKATRDGSRSARGLPRRELRPGKRGGHQLEPRTLARS